MIQTTIVPESTTLNIKIPNNYVGKKVYALFYIDEEINQDIVPAIFQKSSLSKEKGEKTHLKSLKKEGRKAIKVSPLVESLTGVIPDTTQNSDDYYEYLSKKHS